MLDWFSALQPVTQALLGGLFTWGVTTAGAAAVFLTAEVNRRLLDAMLGFAGGVMIFVVVEELIPESHHAGNVDLATLCLMLGFTLMMILDVGFG